MDLQQAQAYCEEKVTQSGSSFYYAFLILPVPQRQALTALYAYCRLVDDVADADLEPQLALQKLNFWFEETERLFEQVPTHPVTIALCPVIKTFRLKKAWFEELLWGMQEEIQGRHIVTWQDLDTYGYQVAGVVGLLSSQIFEDEQSDIFSVQLGQSLQIINIIRDWGEDLRKGRIYIPEELLTAHHLNPDLLMGALKTHSDRASFKPIFQALSDRAREHYQKALAALSPASVPKQLPSLIMGAIYLDLLKVIEETDFDVWDQKISLTPFRKSWIAVKTYYRHRFFKKKMRALS